MAPWATDTKAIKDITPIIIPSIVKPERVLVAIILEKANRAAINMFMPHHAHH